ncbi:MAG: hypothetical protein KDC80_10565 [Saprospiraceae bacterium]|nr:hypothetical protein [Saprospiraceae bacterium]
MLVRTGLYLAITVFAVLIVAWIQYQDTGRWFEFISIQENWGNRLQFPNLPLTSWAGGFIIRLDGIALFVAAAAGITLLLYLFKKRGLPSTPLPREVALSFGYLGGMAALSLLIKGGTLASLNRYVFAVPFIIVAFNFYLRSEIKTTIKQTLVFFLIIFFYWFLFRSFVHIVTLLLYTSVTFYACLFMLMKSGSTSLSRWSTFLLIGINLVFQVIFMVRFLNGIWVG